MKRTTTFQTEFRDGSGTKTTLAPTAHTITLGALAAGAGRIGVQVDEGEFYPDDVDISFQTKSGAVAPTAGDEVEVYLVRSDNHPTDEVVVDGLGVADAAVAALPGNVQLLGSVTFTADADTVFKNVFRVTGLPRKYSLLVWNAGAQVLATADASHILRVTPAPKVYAQFP